MSERRVALEFCHGLTDKEVAAKLIKSYWTIKVQKKAIYHKLGVTKDTELVMALICERMGIAFDLHRLREQGIELITYDANSTI